jgi:hypothetical protein
MESEKLLKLKDLNSVDMFMYFIVCISAYTGLIQVTFADDLSKLMFEFFSLLLLSGNAIFLMYWNWKVTKLILKHLKMNPKTICLYHIFTCNRYKPKEENPIDELEKPANAFVVEEEQGVQE